MENIKRGGLKSRILARLQVTSGVFIATILALIFFSIANPHFFTWINILGILRAMSALAIMALGELLVIVVGEIDLSVGAVYGFTAMLLGILWSNEISIFLSFPLALFSSIVIGVIISLLVIFVKIPSFVVTLGMMSLMQGVTMLICDCRSISPAYLLPQGFEHEVAFFNSMAHLALPFNIPAQVVWMIIIAIIISILYYKFIFGFRLRAIGGNLGASRLLKLPVVKYKIIVFAISGLLSGLAGILDFAFIGTTNPTSGSTLTFPVFAAVIIGGASLSGGKGNVLGTLVAAALLAVLSNGLSLLNVGAFGQLIFTGVVTIGAVALDTMNIGKKIQKS